MTPQRAKKLRRRIERYIRWNIACEAFQLLANPVIVRRDAVLFHGGPMNEEWMAIPRFDDVVPIHYVAAPIAYKHHPVSTAYYHRIQFVRVERKHNLERRSRWYIYSTAPDLTKETLDASTLNDSNAVLIGPWELISEVTPKPLTPLKPHSPDAISRWLTSARVEKICDYYDRTIEFIDVQLWLNPRENIIAKMMDLPNSRVQQIMEKYR